MLKTKKTKLSILFMSIVLAFCFFMGLACVQGEVKKASAASEKDITNTISVFDWGTPEHTEVRNFVIQNNGDILTNYTHEYWNDHGAENANANNGVDLMEYILIDGESVRSIVTKNANGETSYTGPFSPFTMGGVYSPVEVLTPKNVRVYMRVLIAYKNNYTLTIKSGFSVTTTAGERLYTTADVDFAVTESSVSKIQEFTLSFEGAESKTILGGTAIGELPAVPVKDGCEGFWAIDGVRITPETVYSYGKDKTAVAVYEKDATNTISVLDMGTPEHAEVRTLFIQNNSENIITSSFAEYWNDNGVANANKNNGVDLMEYILIDGVSMRDIVTANANGQTSYTGPFFPFNIGGVFSPVELQTVANNHISLRVLIAYKNSYILTIKAGFSITTLSGENLCVKQDVEFAVSESSVGKVQEYTLSFEGAESKKVQTGKPIGELPTIIEKVGYTSCWIIDDEVLTSETIWSRNSDATAIPCYIAKSYTLTFDFGDGNTQDLEVSYKQNIGELPVIPYQEHSVGAWTIDGEVITADTIWQYDQDKTATIIYQPKTYTVTFDGDNATTVQYGEKITKPQDPTKPSTAEFNYVFEGWYNGESKWDFENDVVAEDINLVSKFTEVARECTITFQITGKEITLDPVKVAYNTTYDLTNLFEGVDLTGYSYTVSVNGISKASITVYTDITVEIVFENAAISSEEESSGCQGSIAIGGISIGVAMVGMVAIALKKKREE